jgi:aminomethyltransferase
MGAFAGWRLPLRYGEGTLAEHLHTRASCSLFDVCHMGELRITGAEASVALDRLMPRLVSDQQVSSCRYNFLLSPTGNVIDDLLVYRLASEEFMLVVNAGRREADLNWLSEQLVGCDCTIADVSADTAKLDLQGPGTFSVLADLDVHRDRLPSYYRCTRIELLGHSVLISRTGYTGELGFELFLAAEEACDLWRRLLAHELVAPAGLGARDTLRLEMGYPLYGHELDECTTPVEAGYGRLLSAGRHLHIAAEALGRSPRKELVGVALEGRRAARMGMTVWGGGDMVGLGTVTSGSFAPSLGRAVALAYVRPNSCPIGMSVKIGADVEHALPARRVVLPFYPHGTARMN